MHDVVAAALSAGTCTVMGAIPRASNDTRLVVVEHAGRTLRAVYKPSAGESPLRDFPAGSLAGREVAAYRLSSRLGLDVVPPTVARSDLSAGPGSLQAYVEDAGDDASITLTEVDEVPAGHAPMFALRTPDERDLVLAHDTSAALRRIAFFDLLANNADRKAGHIIRGSVLPGLGTRGSAVRSYGIDNGLTFHVEDKLRTVLWGFSGSSFTAAEARALDTVATMPDELRDDLVGVLSATEIASLRSRAEALAGLGVWPEPAGDRMIIPWPPI
ncbi:putative repeat protein (TIGR03843 family) [Brevibacterium sanguinis]|uniref:Repeat protein (TIGR03843 family) n=2 Tax=Brevibacterium TaxID=1696 RepID=A0ABX9GT18_9MICO|nr:MULTISPECIES: SCO1664 family protein [Brevibacterium]RBP64686.1 putative repeat protein (TIGR03843 family) [Brevibacterium sanguinis]RBP71671.1 putative repeat protein (TIGR03843 family) [Brevibacterium celere]